MCINPSTVEAQRDSGWQRIVVPCKRCWQCRENRLNDYVGRCLCEAAYSDWTVTMTLTYADRDDLAHQILTPRHFQLFIKRLRRAGHKIRYLVTGEHGETFGRAHFHCILFGKGKPLQIPQNRITHIPEWPHGHVFADWSADHRAIRYVCKYLLDDQKDKKAQRWFSLSKKPTLGAEFFEAKAAANVEAGTFPSGFEYMPPGGRKSQPYLVTGATRRDYLLAIIEGKADKGIDPRRLNQWVVYALERLQRHEHQSACSGCTMQELIDALSDKLDRMRPTARQCVRQFMRYASQLESEGYPVPSIDDPQHGFDHWRKLKWHEQEDEDEENGHEDVPEEIHQPPRHLVAALSGLLKPATVRLTLSGASFIEVDESEVPGTSAEPSLRSRYRKRGGKWYKLLPTPPEKRTW